MEEEGGGRVLNRNFAIILVLCVNLGKHLFGFVAPHGLVQNVLSLCIRACLLELG